MIERVLLKKVYDNGQLKQRVFYINDNFLQIINASGTYNYTYVFHEGQLVSIRNPNGNKQYVHTDHKESVHVITDSTGKTIENVTYAPYGEIVSGGSRSRYNYENKEQDKNTAEIDFHARSYKPQ